jgi:GNAT superfamily N-acetyltransferase
VRIVEYDPSRRSDVAALMHRVWGSRPDEEELAWFYERNPVRPASVLLAEEDGTVAGTVAIAFQRMSIGGEDETVGMAVRLATDPAYRGRGVFSELQAANEERARAAGVSLLFTVPTRESERILVARLGWTSLPPLRVWAKMRLLGVASRSRVVERFDEVPVGEDAGLGDRVLRDAAWLNWRFADSPWPYTLVAGDGYGVIGVKGRFGIVAAISGRLIRAVTGAGGKRMLAALPPPAETGAYRRAGYMRTRRRFALLGKSLDPARPLPAAPHFEFGDLDFT